MHGVEDRVVRVDAQHHRREERVVVRARAIFRRQHAEREGARAAGNRRALVRGLDLHVATEEWPLDEVIRAARVGQLGHQLRVDRGAVKALVVVLEDELPVGLHVVLDPPYRAQRRDVETRETAGEGRERALERLRVA
jgi:hypothetical protein